MWVQLGVVELLVAHTIILPELPVECGPGVLQRSRASPRPGTLDIAVVPQEHVHESGTHAQIAGDEVHDPCRRIVGKALLGKQRGVDLVFRVENEELVVLGTVLIVEELREEGEVLRLPYIVVPDDAENNPKNKVNERLHKSIKFFALTCRECNR